jgi:hypothetical protein
MGGIFGGGSKSKSSKVSTETNTWTTTNVTDIDTTTSTSMGDVGLTGQDAVDLASIIGATEIERANVFGQVMEDINASFGTYASDVMAETRQGIEQIAASQNVGFSNLIDGFFSAAQNIMSGVKEVGETQKTGFAESRQVLSEQAGLVEKLAIVGEPGNYENQEMLKLALLAIVGFVAINQFK